MKLHDLFLLTIVLTTSTATHALLIDFDTDADFDGNFVELQQGAATSRDASGYLVTSGSNAATTMILNTSATGGSNGSGGTTFGSPRDLFGGGDGFEIQADIQFKGTDNGTSFGIFTKVPTGETSGYGTLFRMQSQDGEVRFWNSNWNPSTGGIGTLTLDVNDVTTGDAVTINNWYTVKLLVEDIGSDVKFTASWWTQGGGSLLGSTSWTDTSSAVTGPGQVGFRLAANNADLWVDNISVVAIPEPSSLALLGLAGLAGLLAARRRR